MEETTVKLLPKLVKGLGFTIAAFAGVGSAVAYYNYKTQKDFIDGINAQFTKMLHEVNEKIGREGNMTVEVFLKLQDIMLLKLAEPYLKITQRSRNKRRCFLPLEGLGGEFEELTARYKRDKKDGQDDDYDNEIMDYFTIHQKHELKVVEIMTKIAGEMLKLLTNLPEEVLDEHLV